MQQKSIPPASLQWRVNSEGALAIRINLTSKTVQVEHPHLVSSEEEEQVYFTTGEPNLLNFFPVGRIIRRYTLQSELIYNFLGYSLNSWGLQQVPHLSSVPTVDLYSIQVMMKWYLAMTITEYSYKVMITLQRQICSNFINFTFRM